ncbi:Asp23/Gls24 family envelope stress response protein [Gulosibacter faecalis]|jgi:hypothetical protein|uniref:Uncharacterized protein n=1 Tax=Gulosibacter faecalis TaxID=272240 RepID=A0ABW5UUV1_9MICO|nr:hypothetical protein [Gulosibacter faecalis]
MSPVAPPLKDGQALDKLSALAERWARSYREVDDETKLRADYDARFRRDAEQLAAQCTAPAREFSVRDWILAVLLWLIIAGVVLLGSMLLMPPPTAGWFWGYAGVAVVIFGLGLGLVYRDTTSEPRAEKRLREKTEWLLGASLRAAESVVRERRAKRS